MCCELDTNQNKHNVLLSFYFIIVLCIVAGIGVQFDKYMTEGDMGGSEHRNTTKKINEHRITARKVNETRSPQHVFLAP